MLDKVIIFQGPPGIGKDTLAGLIAAEWQVATYEFKTALYTAAADHFNVCPKWLKSVNASRAEKELPHPALQGMSPRDALIYASEVLLKENDPESGAVGHALVKQMLPTSKGCTVFITDGGTNNAEIHAVANSAKHTFIVQLTHPDFYFTDTRKYITIDSLNIHTIDFPVQRGAIKADAKTLSGMITDTLWEFTREIK